MNTTRRALRAATAPDIWFKTQRVLRTAFAVIISILTTFAGTVLTVEVFAPQILDELARILPAGWIAWLTAAFATLAVVASVITRIMAIPKVNTWLTRIGLGSVPISEALRLQQNAEGTDAAPPITTPGAHN